MKFTRFNELIISSGGIKGISLVGSLNELNKHYPIHNFKYLTGCSIGSIICLLINIDYTMDEINEIALKIDFSEFQDLKLMNFIEKNGLDDGLKMTNLLKAFIINKKLDPAITFLELFKKTNKILTTTTVNITKGITEYHNYLTEPNLSILLSLRMSTNIPILFSPITYNNNSYIDGAFLDPYPYNYHKNLKKIGLWLIEKGNIYFIKNNCFENNNSVNNSINYIMNLLNILFLNYMKKYYRKIPKNTIYIDNNISMDLSFKLDILEKTKIYKQGIKKSKNFFKLLNKKKRIYFLMSKYYYLWREKIKKNI